MIIKKFEYRGYACVLIYSTGIGCYREGFHADYDFIPYYHRFKTGDEAIDCLKKEIDEFLDTSVTTIEELNERICEIMGYDE